MKLKKRKRLKDLLVEKNGNFCFYCGTTKKLTIDHVIPKSKGGSNRLENLVLACKDCNTKKGAKLFFTKFPVIDLDLKGPAYWEH